MSELFTTHPVACRQTPACFGSYQDRVVFTTQTGKRTQNLFVGRAYSADIQIVHGGLAHGIREGDEFILYDTTADRIEIGKAKATKCYATCSDITPDQPIARESFYCKLDLNCHDLQVYVDPSIQDLPNIIPSRALNCDQAVVIISEVSGDSTKVALSFGPAFVTASTRDSENCLPYKKHVSKTDLEKVLMSMVRFRRFLGARMPDKVSWLRDTRVQFVPVKCKPEAKGQEPVWVKECSCPSGQGPGSLYDDCICPVQDGYTTKIKVNTLDRPYNRTRVYHNSHPYGMCIANNSVETLFTYVIRFDPRTLAIGRSKS
jgi:hypothetical protein